MLSELAKASLILLETRRPDGRENPNEPIESWLCTHRQGGCGLYENIGNQWLLWNFIKKQYPQLIEPHNLMDCAKKMISWLEGLMEHTRWASEMLKWGNLYKIKNIDFTYVQNFAVEGG